MDKRRKKTFLDTITNHVFNNIKQYTIISIIFLIGVIIEVMFINNIDISNQETIQNYLNTFMNSLKNDYEIDRIQLLRTSIANNLITAILIWFMGSTVIGIPIVYIIVCMKGFSLGFTISSAIITFGIWKGILFSLSSVLLQNIIIIPSILALAVSGIRLYKSIIKDKKKENIKIEMLRHTIFSTIICVFLIISSLVEVYISNNIFIAIIKYI